MAFIQSKGCTERDLILKQIWRRFIWRRVSFNKVLVGEWIPLNTAVVGFYRLNLKADEIIYITTILFKSKTTQNILKAQRLLNLTSSNGVWIHMYMYIVYSIYFWNAIYMLYYKYLNVTLSKTEVPSHVQNSKQAQERLVSTLEHMQVPILDTTRCPEEWESSVCMPHPLHMFHGNLAYLGIKFKLVIRSRSVKGQKLV